MKSLIFYTFIIFLLKSIPLSKSQRKIKDGSPINTDKNYVAYLLKAEQSPREYDAWMCGGAIVSPSFIVTSAACVEDVEFMYAIAGYAKYVKASALAKDECANALKKKVVLSCVPKSYNLSYSEIEQWSYIDIAAVKVESPYDFAATHVIPECKTSNVRWNPQKIKINYDPKFQMPGTDALVLGWGHISKWRAVDDTKDYNQEILHYGSTLIQNKTACKKYYNSLPLLKATIDKYMICTLKAGNIDDKGEQIVTAKPIAEGCTEAEKKAGRCMERTNHNPYTQMRSGSVYEFDDVSINLLQTNQSTPQITRRSGICQNDHGGPLVTWIGAHEVLIGVASVFRISNQSECVGPYLFTSTQCNGAFLDCVITDYDEVVREDEKEQKKDEKKFLKNGDDPFRRTKDVCSMSPAARGFEIVQRRISWKHHPAGPAKNELAEEVFERPQISLSSFNKSPQPSSKSKGKFQGSQ